MWLSLTRRPQPPPRHDRLLRNLDHRTGTRRRCHCPSRPSKSSPRFFVACHCSCLVPPSPWRHTPPHCQRRLARMALAFRMTALQAVAHCVFCQKPLLVPKVVYRFDQFSRLCFSNLVRVVMAYSILHHVQNTDLLTYISFRTPSSRARLPPLPYGPLAMLGTAHIRGIAVGVVYFR
jgi:hypothetical protein